MIGVIGVVVVFVAGYFLARHGSFIKKAETDSTKRGFILRSLQESRQLTQRGIVSLQQKDADMAVELFTAAIKVFPLNNEAYGYLLKVYLMRGQEYKIYETLERAGRSYPAFDQLLNVIDDKDLARIPMPDTGNVYIAPFPGNKKMAVSFMFDDGEESVYTGVMPIFDQFGYKASISVIPSEVAAYSGDPYRGSWAQWKDAADRGFEIASHSMHHLDAKKLKPADYKVEIDDAKALIEQKIGRRVFSYVFPLDSFSEPVLKYVLQSHPAVRDPVFLRSIYDRTVDIMYGGPNFSTISANRLIDIGINRHLWLISECHGIDIHSERSYKPLSKDFLSVHLSYIKAHEKDIWVGTFSGVFSYLMIRKAAQVERRDIADGQAEVVLHNVSVGKELLVPMTVVLKVAALGSGNVSAVMPDGKSLKAWVCGSGEVCVDVGSYDQPVRVRWAGAGL